MNVIAGAAIALKRATEPAFRAYAAACLTNARAMATTLVDAGGVLVTGGTDNHLLVLDVVKSFGIDGRDGERALDAIGLATNKQIVPDDPNPPMRPSGVRLGTPACTSRGLGEDDFRRVATWIADALRHSRDAEKLAGLADDVRTLAVRFPVPGLVGS